MYRACWRRTSSGPRTRSSSRSRYVRACYASRALSSIHPYLVYIHDAFAAHRPPNEPANQRLPPKQQTGPEHPRGRAQALPLLPRRVGARCVASCVCVSVCVHMCLSPSPSLLLTHLYPVHFSRIKTGVRKYRSSPTTNPNRTHTSTKTTQTPHPHIHQPHSNLTNHKPPHIHTNLTQPKPPTHTSIHTNPTQPKPPTHISIHTHPNPDF